MAHPLRIAVAAVALLRVARTLGPAARLGAEGAGPPAGDASAGDHPTPGSRPRVTVVVPARDEEGRIGACLDGLAADGAVDELLVVDDRSTDATAEVARAHGAVVVMGQEPPPGRVGKPWALEQGLRAASGDVVVAVDADVRARPGLVAALVVELVRREAEGARPVLLSAWPAVDVRGLERLLHPAFAATVALRFGPVDGRGGEPQPSRATANGRLLCARARPLREAGGFALAAGHLADDVALARALAGRGWLVAGADAAALADLRVHEGARATWRGLARGTTAADATGRGWIALDLLVLWGAQALPWVRLAAGRADALDGLLIAGRAVVLAGAARPYRARGIRDPFWWSWTLDVPVVVAFTRAVLRPDRRWRGRAYA